MFGDKIINFFCKTVGKADMKRISSQKPPQNVVSIKNIEYKNDNNPLHTLDIYYKEGSIGTLPTIIDIHGGGWVYGNKEINEYFCMYLASRGFLVININYRLITESRFPSQIKDIYSVFNWIECNFKEYMIDLENLFIMGDSAGAHLASLSVAYLNKPNLQEKFKISSKLIIKGCCLICGIYNVEGLLRKKIPFVGNSLGNYFLGKDYKNYENLKYLNLFNIITSDFPPTIIITGKGDFLRKQSLLLEKKLNDLAVKNYIINTDSRQFKHVYNIIKFDQPMGISVNIKISTFFKNLSSIQFDD